MRFRHEQILRRRLYRHHLLFPLVILFLLHPHRRYHTHVAFRFQHLCVLEARMIDLNRRLPLNLLCVLASHFKFSSDLLILEIIPLLTYLSYYQFKLLECNMLLCNFFTIKSKHFLNFWLLKILDCFLAKQLQRKFLEQGIIGQEKGQNHKERTFL